MRAVICDSFDGVDALRVSEVPDAAPIKGTVLVDVKACGVNFADSLLVSGLYQTRPELPFTPGSEVAGIVEAAPAVSGVAVGERVSGYLGFGGYAEKAHLFPGSLIRLPEDVSFVEGSAVPVAYGTAYHALVDRAALDEGETLLVLGASGGVGMAAVQIGVHLGARVVAAVSSDEKENLAVQSGAAEVIRTDRIDLRTALVDITGNRGVDVVLDPVGGDLTEPALRSTGWNGRVLVVGFAAGTIPSIPLNLPLVKGNSLVGVFFGRFCIEEPESAAANNARIEELLQDGIIRPHVQRTFSLEETPEAIDWVAQRKATGRVVVVP